MVNLILLFQNSDAGGFVCCGVIIIAVIAVLVSFNKTANKNAQILLTAKNRKKQELQDAENNYRNSLASLKDDPTNADLRQQTLALGRAYSSFTRDNTGVTIYDEMALMNDINAACATAQAHPSSQHTAGNLSIEERLTQLLNLKSKDLIDEDEFNSRRQKILDEV